MLAVVVAGPIESNNIAGAMEIKLLIKFWSQKWTLAFFYWDTLTCLLFFRL